MNSCGLKKTIEDFCGERENKRAFLCHGGRNKGN